MPHLREYFETDFPHHLRVDATLPINSTDGKDNFSVVVRVHLDFEASALYVSALIEDQVNPISVTESLFQGINDLITALVGQTRVSMGFHDLPFYASSDELKYCGRLFVYTNSEPTSAEWDKYLTICHEREFYPVLRGPSYVRKKNELEHPKAFICHDSKDKKDVALKIAEGLRARMCPVWYDDFSLNVGDSLRESIEKGIKEAGACVLILSQNFLSNEGWTKSEFDSIYTREIVDKKLLFLPVWHGVGVKDVFEYSPKLADRKGVNTEIGMDGVVDQLHKAIISRDR